MIAANLDRHSWRQKKSPSGEQVRRCLESVRFEVTEEEKLEEALSEPEEEMDTESTPAEEIVSVNCSLGTTRELPQDLSGEEWADTTTPPLGSPRKNLELQLGSQPVDMGLVFLSSESKEKNTFEGNKTMFMSTLDQEGWQKFLMELDQKVERKVDVEEFKEELWDIVVEFGEPILMRTGLHKEAREELLSKMIHVRETRWNTEPRFCKYCSTLKKSRKKVKTKMSNNKKPIFKA